MIHYLTLVTTIEIIVSMMILIVFKFEKTIFEGTQIDR